ncbi:type 4a pilus biogenesis protein PilO [Candidatus Microgenomates bacterium]|nr:type 4a pilus biogenesis protein PilO [Candidatus Microgenomates bacterium]
MPKTRLTGSVQKLGNSGLIATLMIVCTVVVALSIVLSRTLLADVRFNNKVIKRKNQVNKTLEQNINSLPELQDNFQDLEKTGPQAGDILKALPVSTNYAGLASEFESMAALSGTQLVTLALESEDTSESTGTVATPVEVAFRASATGSYQKLQQFLLHIETSGRPVRINSMSFSGSEPTVTVELGLTTYYQPLTVIGDTKETIR